MKVTVFVLWAFSLSILVGCSDDDSTTYAPLAFEQTYYEKPLMINESIRRIAFTGGSGDFSLSVSNPDVLEAKISDDEVILTPKEKGRTNIVVRDNVDDRSVTIQVKIVAPYICLRVDSPLPDGKLEDGSRENLFLFLVNDSEKSVYCFDESFNLKSVDHGYSFSYSKEVRRFYFSLPLAGNMFTYEITTNQWSFLLQVLPRDLGVSWDGLDMQSRATEIVSAAGPILLMAVDLATGDKYNFIVRSIEMPYGILD